MRQLIAIPIDGRPPRVRRITGRLACLFTAPGKMCVPYTDREHVYVRYGRNQWARVEVAKRKRTAGPTLTATQERRMKYLTEKELRAAEKRNAFADRMAALLGIDKVSEFERLVAEVRAARAFRASLGLKTWPAPKARQRRTRKAQRTRKAAGIEELNAETH